MAPTTVAAATNSIHITSSTGCAWTEGFAEWVPVMVFDNTTYLGTDMEGPTWGTFGWHGGDSVEGHVAGALIDLWDTNK